MQSIVSELRRRNVFRVAMAYALSAWIIIEAGSVLLPTFGAPESAFKIYVLVVLAGFVAAVVFAWIFEITPEGVKLDRNVDRTLPEDAQSRHRMNYAIIGLLVVALCVSITFNVTGIRGVEPEEAVDAQRQSIAVLPFTSRSTDPDNALFADGIHDDLLTRLANIGSLKVISRTSVMEYRDTTKNLTQIGEELGVATVLEGSVQRSGDNVRINVQLIDAQTDQHLWAKSYDRKLTMQDIFSIQSEISGEISIALKATLTPDEQTRMAEVPTQNPRAYGLYTAGRSNLHQRKLETLQLAREQFEQAIALDPDYAEAHAGLAESVLLLSINHVAIAMEDAYELAGNSLRRALELNPDLADAYATLGLLKTNQWSQTRVGPGNVEAETAFRQALALNPNHASAYLWFASLRDTEQRQDEAIELYRRSIELDPLGRIPYLNLPMLHAQRGNNAEALRLWVEAAQTFPDWSFPRQYVANQLVGMGRLDEALAWHHEAAERNADVNFTVNILVGLYLAFDDVDKARHVLMDVPDDHPMKPITRVLEPALTGDYRGTLSLIEQMRTGELVPPKFFWDFAADIAVLADDYGQAREYTLLANPVLAADAEMPVDRYTLKSLLRLALIQKQSGENDKAYEILNRTLPVIQELPRLGVSGHGIRDAQAYALLGRREDAFSALRDAVDEGYRGSIFFDFWSLDQDPFLESLRGDPRFVSILDEIGDAVSIMRDRAYQAQASGDWSSLLARAGII